MLQQEEEEIVFGKELATTKVDDIVVAFVGKGRTVQKILKNYCFPHKKVTFVSARTISTRPNLLHNNDRLKVIP
jgi:hypothetical protein